MIRLHAGVLAAVMEFMLPTLLLTFALAQADLERVFHFTHTETAQSIQEVATVVRTITGLRELSTDAERRTLTFRGTAGQGSLADWLLVRLDRPVGNEPNPPAFQADLPGEEDRTVKVFYLKNTKPGQELQEMATVVRSVAEIRSLFIYNQHRAIVMRGTAAQAALAEWLIARLDDQVIGPAEYRVQPDRDDVVHIFSTPYGTTVQQLNERATKIRKAMQARQIFTYGPQRGIVLRGTPAMVAGAIEVMRQ